MLDDDKTGPVDQLNTQFILLHQIGPTTLRKCTHRTQQTIDHETSVWKQFPGIIEIMRIKMITNINCRIVLGLVKTL
jgi:hypothetical protein